MSSKETHKKLAIFTLVVHKKKDGQYYGYAPYVSEMNMWTSHFDEVIVVGPLSSSTNLEKIDLNYSHGNLSLVEVPVFHIKSFLGVLKLVASLPGMFFKMYKVMRKADYFHFRCPSNVSAVAAVVQIFFPKKPKSTKYAGNWDPNSNQPIGYRFQKRLLANRLLTKNMKVLVYGEWPNQSKSVVPFMSATYRDNEKLTFQKRDYTQRLKFVFIGAMVVGKRPLLTVKIIEALRLQGFDAELHMFGDGDLMDEVKQYVEDNQLSDAIEIYGNRNKETVKDCIQDAHFTILPSKSEGWPKAIAEGMFFGAIPVSTRISCLPWILNEGERGILISDELDEAVDLISTELRKGNEYLNAMAEKSLNWAQQYTLDRLEQEIEKVVTSN
ncbi:glycosyltransferase family 4 protein [Winogradskyella tangerina]|uniref:glycosyltransferase family 4 protein n=1 Tax=Winogradskyella tangerina TaxID=2023240 RepID=UPI001E475295|nr:glycosyltransferase [Winogradskyella tangerina]